MSDSHNEDELFEQESDLTQEPGGTAIEEPPSKDQGVLYLGIDLGTSRTSVSASNGVRETDPFLRRIPQGRRQPQKLLKKERALRAPRRSRNAFRSEVCTVPLEHGVLKCSEDHGARTSTTATSRPPGT